MSSPRDHAIPSPEALRAIRRYAGLTQAAAARMAGASLEEWLSWEAGEAVMPAAGAWLLGLALIYHI